jgi:hypothetical protein
MRLLFGSSFVFFSNFIHNAYHKQYVYAWIFLLLTTTSIFVHSGIFEDDLQFNNQVIALDKTIIACIFFYGSHLYWKSLEKKIVIFPVISILIVIWFYVCGYFLGKYCFHLNRECANIYHSLIHIIGSLGHHSIIWEYANCIYT